MRTLSAESFQGKSVVGVMETQILVGLLVLRYDDHHSGVLWSVLPDRRHKIFEKVQVAEICCCYNDNVIYSRIRNDIALLGAQGIVLGSIFQYPISMPDGTNVLYLLPSCLSNIFQIEAN